jgi:hypothetical protein
MCGLLGFFFRRVLFGVRLESYWKWTGAKWMGGWWEFPRRPPPACGPPNDAAGGFDCAGNGPCMGAVDSMKEPIKVLIAIPNMGYTQCEAYGNRLMNFMQMGNFQTERQTFARFADLLKDMAPEKADAILNAYIEKHGYNVKKLDEELFQFYFISIGRIFTPAARDEAAKKAVEHGMDLLFFVDDDMICPDDLFYRLYKAMQQSGADIICPLAFTRNPPYNPVLYASMEGWDPFTNRITSSTKWS